MRKFLVLLKKEIKELLNLQMLIPLISVIIIFIFIGNVVGNETKKAQAQQKVIILDMDKTLTSGSLAGVLSTQNFKVELYSDTDIENVIEKARTGKSPVALVIPAGFEKGILEFKPQQVDVYTIVQNFSFTGIAGNRSVSAVLSAINESISSQLILRKAQDSNPAELKNPVRIKDFVVIGNKTANVGPDQVMGFIISQTTFIPIIMFIIIIIASQMIAVSIASEKENKTLETLLSTPISRGSLVSAKMIAAGIVSLLTAFFYMFGFRYYMNGITGNAMGGAANPQMREAAKQLGLALEASDYVLLGTSLFMSILIALAISIILGTFADDVKKVQGLIAPIVFLIMIPYFLVMFIDLGSASLLTRYLVYAIPFSHPFLAAPNLFLHKYSAIVYGIIYQAVVFAVFVYIAARIFSTDRILTMKIGLKLKKRSLKFNK